MADRQQDQSYTSAILSNENEFPYVGLMYGMMNISPRRVNTHRLSTIYIYMHATKKTMLAGKIAHRKCTNQLALHRFAATPKNAYGTVLRYQRHTPT
jgi:hypothetical protein